jgi:hypothetical protein
MTLLVFLGTGQSGCFTSEIGQIYVLWAYKSNTTNEIKIQGPEVPK